MFYSTKRLVFDFSQILKFNERKKNQNNNDKHTKTKILTRNQKSNDSKLTENITDNYVCNHLRNYWATSIGRFIFLFYL